MELHERADGVTVVNDAYNANPDSMRAALKALAAIGRGRPGARTVAVLGEMLELGDVGREEHDAVGRLAVRARTSTSCSSSARRRGRSTSVPRLRGVLGRRVGLRRRTATRRADWLRRQCRPRDVVLVKASNGAAARAAWPTRCWPTDRRRRLPDTGREETQSMKAILLAGGLSLIFTLLGTRVAIRVLHQAGYGQLIRDDGPTTHHTKRGTPDHGRRW